MLWEFNNSVSCFFEIENVHASRVSHLGSFGRKCLGTEFPMTFLDLFDTFDPS